MNKVKIFIGMLCAASLMSCGDARNNNAGLDDLDKITSSLNEQQCGATNGQIVESIYMEDQGFKPVDLGLSVKWASCNLGADKPEGSGEYYAWGEVNVKSDYNANNSKTYSYSLSELRSMKIIDSKNVLLPSKDVVTQKMGKDWRMPTKEETQELLDNCTWEWVLNNGSKGFKVTGKNGNYIYLPAKGYFFGAQLYDTDETGNYWTSTCYDNGNFSYTLDFTNRRPKVNSSGRSGGRCIRPVYNK